MLVLSKSLLFCVIEKDKADGFMTMARHVGAGGGTIIPAKGTASNSLLRVLGLGSKDKEIILILADEELAEKIICEASADASFKGICALISGNGEGDYNMGNEFKLITVIVNGGYADDVMDTARKAGATGGTITHARGTAPKDQEEKFLNITIVPEKDMVMILCKSAECDAIVDSIRNMECLSEQGAGIVFVQDVRKVVNLGEK